MKRALGWSTLVFVVLMAIAMVGDAVDGAEGGAGMLLGVVYGALAGYGALVTFWAIWDGE